MSHEKPANLSEYKKWLDEVHGFKVTDKEKNYYEQVATKVKDSFENSLFWTEFINNLQEYNDEYALAKHYPLLAESSPILEKKSWESFLEKSFRKNILFNDNFPDPPKGGWVLENNWYSRTNDIVRTLIVVKYLDGVEFLIKKLNPLAI